VRRAVTVDGAAPTGNAAPGDREAHPQRAHALRHLDGVGEIGLVEDAAPDADSVLPQFPSDPARSVLVPIEDHHLGSPSVHVPSRGLGQARCAAGHECDTSVDLYHRTSVFSSISGDHTPGFVRTA